jgi:cell division protein FtsB
MSDQKTTTKVRAVSSEVLDEMRAAQNALQEAVKNLRANPTNKDLQLVAEAARQRLYEVEDLYREGRMLKLAHVLDHPRRGLPS